MGKLSDQLEGEALELVLLDQLVQVDGQKLERDAGVGPERERSGFAIKIPVFIGARLMTRGQQKGPWLLIRPY